ncbi:PD-(D/E)XK nuclease-like domain-containing protein [Tellurirhabdus rosea]|uniref:PD-(D/E)XK nuclease-like domain-containing protein n=1 Tax=Tellurirhabdus rosea TaxID=2674997 RepID=UPI002259F57B|nr:PD-(D/E)XK nuclease-like domain-containing protein [Tellurirhabdus rosea]
MESLLPLIDYRLLPRVSNSDLTRLKEEYLGYGTIPSARFFPETARTFGKAFHQHLLEPETIGGVIQQLLPDMARPDTTRVEQLTERIRQDAFCRRYLGKAERCARPGYPSDRQEDARREHIVLFTDPTTDVDCKARLDLVYTSPKRRNALILDFKTTSARSQSQFLQSCYDYDYDRQVAFYLDALRHADSREWQDTRTFRFVLIGVQKQKPNRLFAVDATSIPDFVDYGRKKYRFWLRKWKEQQTTEAQPLLRQAS